jgi:hypothetical protein
MTAAQASGMAKPVVVRKKSDTEAHTIAAMLVSQRLDPVILDRIGCF